MLQALRALKSQEVGPSLCFQGEAYSGGRFRNLLFCDVDSFGPSAISFVFFLRPGERMNVIKTRLGFPYL